MKGALPDFKNACNNCGEKICLNDSVILNESLENAVCLCSEECRHEAILKKSSINKRNSFSDLQNDFFR